MKLSKELQKWVDQKLISQKQAEKILLSEQSRRSNSAWRLMYSIAALLIGLGIILIISSNWGRIPDLVKLAGNFTIWAGILYGTYWSVVNKRNKLKEFFLTLSFLFVAATIGLIAQIFHLSGGWHSFALTWTLLSSVFVIFSRLTLFNLVWLILFFSAINKDFFKQLEDLMKVYPITSLLCGTTILALLSYSGNQLYKWINKLIVLPKAFGLLFFWGMYAFALIAGASLGFKYVVANVFVFVFLAIRLLLALYNKNIKSFTYNTYLIELYILFLFVEHYGNLFKSGIGFLCAGFIVLLFLYILKKTSKYIKRIEVFHE